MDLSKLPPAPWIGVVPQSATSGECWIQDENAKVHLFGKLTTFNASAIEFIALARNAFDLMMRRGPNWLYFTLIDGKLAVEIDDYGWMPGVRFSDPFTAWVEADKWYREHVELTPPSSPPPIAPDTIPSTSPNG